MANQKSITAEKKSKKNSVAKFFSRLFKRPSAHTSGNQSNLIRSSAPSALGVNDHIPAVPESDAGTAERTPHGNPANDDEDSTSTPRPAGPQSSDPPHGSNIGQGAIKQEPQIPAIPKSLPSQLDETLYACPKFRIVLVGKSGVGKSSLIANIFNIDKKQIDIAHNRAGVADIEYEYTSPENPRFILHDSMGFEPGSEGNWEKVRACLESRKNYELPRRIHAIWFCILTPRTGARLLQTGDEKLLQLANKLNIPIFAVFTKYDLLVNQFAQEDRVNMEAKASASFDTSVKEMKDELKRLSIDIPISCVKFSTKKPNVKESLLNLTQGTRDELQAVERELVVLWVAAQQVNARQKVEVSISEGFKKYWLDLGQSNAFEGQILIDCIHRLHDDVLKVWNFNDPTGILSGINFFTEIIGLVKHLFKDKADEVLFRTAHVPAFGIGGAKELVAMLQKFGLTPGAINYLYDRYQRFPSTAKLLASYIVNLILVLYGIFTRTLPSEPPRKLSTDVVSKVLSDHKEKLGKEALNDIDLFPQFSTHPEKVIETEIRKRLLPDAVGGGTRS